MSIYEEAIQLTNRMSMAEKVRLLEYLSTALKHDLEVEAYKHIPWQQFIDLTYGSLADDPIERNQPLQPDMRDEIECGTCSIPIPAFATSMEAHDTMLEFRIEE